MLHSEDTRFKYVVWNYSSPAAQAIVYGVGEFVYEPVAPNLTQVSWTYAFELNERARSRAVRRFWKISV